MPLGKKRRNQLWYGYVIAMFVYYEAAMLALGYTVVGFLAAFGGIAVLTLAFVILMRRLSRPAGGTAPTVGAVLEPARTDRASEGG